MNSNLLNGARVRQQGSTVVEFALIVVFFLTLLLGIMEFGRALYVWNSIGEVTRMGARLAVVCSQSSANVIRGKMEAFPSLATLANGNILINYLPAGCDQTNCKSVEVKITGASFTPAIPLFALTIALPDAVTTLPRESMDSAGGTNPVCLP